MAALDLRRRHPFVRGPSSRPSVSMEELAATFADVDVLETTALLTVIAAMSPDELVRARARRALARRDHQMPAWLQRLGDILVYRAAEMTHVLGDGDNVVLGVRLATGHELSAVVYIDHNLGTLVKDAFVVPGPIAALIEFMRTKTDDPDLTWQDIPLADARAKIARAIGVGAKVYPSLETETWPGCRPLLEWLIRSLPREGTGYARSQWSERATKDLARRFFSSSFGASLKDADHRGLLESVLWFGVEHGPGDPMRWSPVNVEILLTSWIPSKVVADAKYLGKAPELLRAFIRFCHKERGIRAELTRQALESVDRYEPEYRRIIRSPRPQGPAALLAAMGMFDDGRAWADPRAWADGGAWAAAGPWGAEDPWAHDGPWGGSDWAGEAESEEWSIEDYMLARAAAAVGGEAALNSLDDAPLPDEDFDWSGIPDVVRLMVAKISAECDKFCQDLGDRELRTACRRLLARAAAGDPDAFRRSSKIEVAAAAVCWAIGKVNDVFGPHGAGLRGGGVLLVKDLMQYFGLTQSSVSQRAEVLLAGTDWTGAPSLLTSWFRHHLIEVRDRAQALLATRETE